MGRIYLAVGIAITCAVVLTTMVFASTGGTAVRSSSTPVVAKVYGCSTEDSCTIDYRGSKQGPVWVIRRDNP